MIVPLHKALDEIDERYMAQLRCSDVGSGSPLSTHDPREQDVPTEPLQSPVCIDASASRYGKDGHAAFRPKCRLPRLLCYREAKHIAITNDRFVDISLIIPTIFCTILSSADIRHPKPSSYGSIIGLGRATETSARQTPMYITSLCSAHL